MLLDIRGEFYPVKTTGITDIFENKIIRGGFNNKKNKIPRTNSWYILGRK
jgi:hypothetical protein